MIDLPGWTIASTANPGAKPEITFAEWIELAPPERVRGLAEILMRMAGATNRAEAVEPEAEAVGALSEDDVISEPQKGSAI